MNLNEALEMLNRVPGTGPAVGEYVETAALAARELETAADFMAATSPDSQTAKTMTDSMRGIAARLKRLHGNDKSPLETLRDEIKSMVDEDHIPRESDLVRWLDLALEARQAELKLPVDFSKAPICKPEDVWMVRSTGHSVAREIAEQAVRGLGTGTSNITDTRATNIALAIGQQIDDYLDQVSGL